MYNKNKRMSWCYKAVSGILCLYGVCACVCAFVRKRERERDQVIAVFE